MAELIVEPIQTAELESSGYIGQPEGNIDLTENNVQVDVTPYKYATPKIPDPVLITKQITANGTYSAEDETPPADGYKDVIVDVPSSIPVDGGSQTPLYFGVHASGFVLSSDPADETPAAFGVNANGHPYVKGGTV